MSKYNSLWEYIRKADKEVLVLSFEQIKEILGFEIDHSFLRYKKELTDCSFEVKKISLKEKSACFVKTK